MLILQTDITALLSLTVLNTLRNKLLKLFIVNRVNAPYNKMGKAMVDIVKNFGWERVVMATLGGATLCDYGARGMSTSFKVNYTCSLKYAAIK